MSRERLRALLSTVGVTEWAQPAWDPKVIMPKPWADDEVAPADRGPFAVVSTALAFWSEQNTDERQAAVAELIRTALNELPELLDLIDRLTLEGAGTS